MFVSVCGWARFRSDLLACWLGVLSEMSHWELNIGAKHCSFSDPQPLFPSVNHTNILRICLHTGKYEMKLKRTI